MYGGDRAAQREMRPWVTVNGVWCQGHEVIGPLPRRWDVERMWERAPGCLCYELKEEL